MSIIVGVVTVLVDRYGRQLLNARFVITLRCNYRCLFCHREGSQNIVDNELSFDDISVLAEALASVGIRKYKVTGGEPLLRSDVVDIVRVLKNYGKAEDLSMTTNGFYLGEYIGGLTDAGLNRVNISLHTLRSSRYEVITGVKALDRVILNIKKTMQYSIDKIKINSVVLKGINDDELWDIIGFAEGLGIHVQLIELHPVGRGKEVFTNYYSSLEEFIKELEGKATKIVVRGELHNRPIYVLSTGVTVEVVRPTSNPIFCAGCSRIRVLPNGNLTPCLNNYVSVPTIDIIKSTLSREEKVSKLVDLIVKVNNIRRPSNPWPLRGDVDIEYMKLLRLGGLKKGFRLVF